jgi:hypothetical protein
VLADRKQILDKRRSDFRYKDYPTVRQQLLRYHSVLDCVAGEDEALRAKIEESGEVDRTMGGDRAYCANPRCMKPWKKGDNKKLLKACGRCKYTMYCSVSVPGLVCIVALHLSSA